MQELLFAYYIGVAHGIYAPLLLWRRVKMTLTRCV